MASNHTAQMTGQAGVPRKLIVTSLLMSMFLSAMEATAVATIMPTVVTEVGGLRHYAWVFSIYMLTATIVGPIAGKAADIFGRRKIFLIGLFVFILSSIGCAMSTNMATLIVMRALQGVGAGAIQPVSLTVIGDIFTFKERARIQGVFGAVWGFAGICGPLLGGFIVQWSHWSWIFWINVPFGLLSALLFAKFYRDPPSTERTISIDWSGAFTLTLTVTSILLAASGIASVPMLVVALMSAVAFVYIEKRASDPILPFSLFQIPIVFSASIMGFIIGGGMYSVVSYLPLYAQVILGAEPAGAGAMLTPLIVGWPIGSAISGRLLPRLGFRVLVLFGGACSLCGCILLAAFVNQHYSLSVGHLATALLGLGLGFMNTSLIIGVQTHVPWNRRGVATASSIFFRTIGGSMIVGLIGAYFATTLITFPEAEVFLQNHLAHVPNLSASAEAITVISGILNKVFYVTVALMLINFVICLKFKEPEPYAEETVKAS